MAQNHRKPALSGWPSRDGSVDLTEREVRTLQLLCAGHSYAEIADAIHFSQRTARRITKRLYDKLGVTSRAEAAYVAGKLGLIEKSPQ